MFCCLDFQSSQRFATFVPIFRWNFLRNPLHVNNESMKDSPRILTLYRDLKVDHIMLYAEGNVKNQFGHFLMLSLIQTWTFSRNTSNITLQR